MNWRELLPQDLEDTLRFLEPWEAQTGHLSSLFWDQTQNSFPPGERALFWGLFENSELQGIVGIKGRGVLLPCLPLPSSHLKGLVPHLLKSLGMHFSILGQKSFVKSLMSALSFKPTHVQTYEFYTRQKTQALGPNPLPKGSVVKKLGPQDCDRYLPLQSAYEREEVVLRPQDFSLQICRHYFLQALQEHIVLGWENKDVPIAKAGTNALSKNWAQLGGIYTHPDFRGKGLGTALLSELLLQLAKSGRSACLFVKSANTPAVQLYKKLNFKKSSDFMISYYNRS